MFTANFKRYILNFKQASGTSRGVLHTKESFFIIISDGVKTGYGECGLFRGLSIDDRPDYEEKLQWVCDNIELGLGTLLNELVEFPSIQFALEQAFLSIKGLTPFELFPSSFTKGEDGIPINGLIWMGEKDFMKKQIRQKLDAGFSCLKMKIGAIDFDTELGLLKSIRKEFSAEEITLRVDANGAFPVSEALEKLKYLSDYDLHSIEQPIKQGQVQEMARLCEETPLDIALDEELIGVFSKDARVTLINTIKPQYVILKPSLVGGFSASKEIISIAEENNAKWWITSALESNIGLNAIAQFTYTLQNKMPQGLGTGSLFTNNIDSPLSVEQGVLVNDTSLKWSLDIS